MTVDLTDEAAFSALLEQHRRGLHVHCYRMLANFEEAEDAVQDAFLRAWRNRESFGSELNVRAWLYRIAINVCLDVLRAKSRRVTELRSFEDVPWLQPYPDVMLDEASPDDVAIDRETIELTFLAALQVLPPRQRATLILRDVMGWPASETAALLDTSVAAANSALQRARETMQDHLPPRRSEWVAGHPNATERGLLDRFIDAHERCDAQAVATIASKDIRITMPPNPVTYDGIAVIAPLLERAFGPERDGDWKLVPTMANRLPAAASYLRRPGDTKFRAFKMDVLRIEDDRVREITTFGYVLFPHFGLPDILDR